MLSVLGEGMPLIYNGQEAGHDKRLPFFERDPIVWREHPLGELYRQLFALKRENTALWNAQWGARMIEAPNTSPSSVLSFVRRNEREKVFVALNFSDAPRLVSFKDGLYHGEFTDYFSKDRVELNESTRLSFAPWGYRVFVK